MGKDHKKEVASLAIYHLDRAETSYSYDSKDNRLMHAARDRPPPVTWLPATVGTLCRQNAKGSVFLIYVFDAISHAKFTC